MKILLVDDHAPTRDELQLLLSRESDMTVVGAFGTGEEAVQHARELQPDVVVMDLMLPGISGIAAAQTIIQQLAGARIVVLSNHYGRRLVQAVQDAGILGYVRKNHAFEEIVPAIRSAYAGKPFLGKQLED